MLDLTHVERSAAIFIAMMCSPDRPFCVAGTAFICKQVGCERTAIYRACAKLQEAELMIVESKKRAGNIYRIVWPYG